MQGLLAITAFKSVCSMTDYNIYTILQYFSLRLQINYVLNIYFINENILTAVRYHYTHPVRVVII